MNVTKKIHDAKLAHWIELFKEQSNSGLTVSDWCAEKGLSKHAYYYWKRLAKEAYTDSVMPEIVQLGSPQSSVSDPIPSAPASLAISDSHELCNSANLYNSIHPYQSVSVSFGDIRIDIGASASDDLIAKVIGVIRHA